MSVLQANCPSCAAPIEFQAGSTIVLVCPYCRSAVARTDRGLADLGKVAEIVESESPLRLGLKGQFNGSRFELTGRAQMSHELGGFWDEWYATFSNGWVGWLAEAQGRFYLTFYQPAGEGVTLPPFDQLTPGQFVPEIQSETPLMVQEKGVATAVAADGEIPYMLTPGETSEYADLAGKNDTFATIDYSMSPPWVFVGRQVTLAEIGLADARPAEREKRRVSAAAMGCPNCGGPLNLVAPDKAERVTCPNCNSLLDVNQGNLSYLHALEPTNADRSFVLPIGAEGAFDDARYKIIGAVIRSVLIDGVHYYWHEYLLYNPSVGFRWLVHSDNHWNLVEPVNPAEVEGDPGTYLAAGATVRFRGQTFKVFQDANARVEYVQGEFYWRVEQGESVRAADYVAAPLMLSRESSANEINWSLGTFLTAADVEKAFGVTDLPRPWGVAPNQPFTGSFYYTWGLLPLVGLLIVAALMVPLAGITNTVLSETVTMQPAAPNASTTAFSQPFELKGNRNVRISASAAFSNSGADLEIDLVDDKKNDVETVNIPISYFQGVEDGESWTEGSPSDSATISSLPAGQYNLRVEGTFENITQPLPVTLKVEQNVNRGVNFGCALIVLLLVPAIGIFRKWSFEGRKWKDSMFTVDTSDDSE